jgi:hypothetical protein
MTESRVTDLILGNVSQVIAPLVVRNSDVLTKIYNDNKFSTKEFEKIPAGLKTLQIMREVSSRIGHNNDRS